MSIQKGSTVTQVYTPIVGITTKTQFNEGVDCLEYLVSYVQNGINHERWFLEKDIVEVAVPVIPTVVGE